MPRKQHDAQWNQRVKLVEEFAAIDREIDRIQPMLARHQLLRSLILGWHAGAAAEEQITVPGTTCDIVITARDKLRFVTEAGKQKLFRLWGPKEFVARANMLLKSLPDPKDASGLYTVQALKGPRHLRVVAKSGAANSAA